MKRIVTFILTITCLTATACQKERGYTGFVDPSESSIAQMSISTDKAMYAPGETVTFTIENPSSGSMKVRYRHLGDVIETAALTDRSWTWIVPQTDGSGYLVEIFLSSGNVEQALATIAVDVSSDWNKFPRYGFLSSYQKMDKEATEKVIEKLNRLHINGIQFQDWHYKHHWPLAGTAEEPIENYLDIASRTSSLTTIKNYISSIHDRGMKAIFYNLCFGALDDSATDGVKESWHLYKDNKAETKDVHELGEPFKSSIYITNPANPDWQEYIGDRNDEIYSVLDFDGYQIDQLGDRGQLYDYDGNMVHLAGTYTAFINAMKSRHPKKELIMNSVSQYGAKEIVSTGKVTFAYNEVWEDRFTDLKDIIDRNNSYTDGGIKTVFAAYMNYDKGKGYFNTPGILLTDAVMFALGGSHLELGEHMLTTEYFPNNNMTMDAELEKSIITYYDFLTAYQNLLRDGGTFNNIQVTTPETDIQIKPWGPAVGHIVTLCKDMGERQVIHLLNFRNADSTSWKDSNGTMPEPEKVDALEIEIDAAKPVRRLWMASPDIYLGVPAELAFTQSGGKIRTEIPSLKYWNMIVIEY